MTKPQYLAELSRLLVFMTAADREETLSRYGTLFDLAGPEGADALIGHIGSPTAAAIRLSRSYEPGSIADAVLESQTAAAPSPAPTPTPEAAPSGPAESVTGDVPPLIIDDLPGYEPPDIPPNFEQDAPAPQPEQDAPAPSPAVPDWVSAPEADSGAQAAPAANNPVPGPDDAAQTEPAAAEQPEKEPEQEAPLYTVERSMPLWVGVPLFILSLAVLALPLGAVCLALIPVLVLPGLALLLGAFLAAVGGLWCISYIADAVMLFGLALVILAAGLVVLWLGLWLLVAIISLYFRAFRGVAHLTLGKKVRVHA